MRTMTREEAMTAKRQVERASYTTTYVAPYYGTGRIRMSEGTLVETPKPRPIGDGTIGM